MPTTPTLRPRLLALALALATTVAVGGATPAGSASAPTAGLERGVVVVTTRLALGPGGAAGTGMIISPGVVLTNNHVIQGAGRITVRDVTTRTRHAATVLGYDVRRDVAVLRIDAPRLPAVTLGDSARVRVGDPVAAVGNADGAGAVTTRGEVTRLRRSITIRDGATGRVERLSGLIQMDATLRPGDSGGPLFDSLGRVIGVNTAASFTFRFRSTGAGYAIPVNRAMAIARQIVAGRGSATVHVGPTARLGVQLRDGAHRGAAGALVLGVSAGTPAERAGLGAGDVILSLGGRRVRSTTALTDAMLLHHPGDAVKVVWIRGGSGEMTSATVTLAEGPPQ